MCSRRSGSRLLRLRTHLSWKDRSHSIEVAARIRAGVMMTCDLGVEPWHEQVTPLILTFNEEANIDRVLDKLRWAHRIVIVDSFSIDATLEIARRFPQVEIFQRAFDNHVDQWNFGLSQVTSEWVLTLDSDYVLSDDITS